MPIWTFEFLCQLMANLVIGSESKQSWPRKLIVGPRNVVTTPRSSTMRHLTWMKSYSLWQLCAQPWLKHFPAPIFCGSRILWLSLRWSTRVPAWPGCVSDQMSQGTRRRRLERRPWPSLLQHSLLKRQRQISEIFWENSAGSSIHPSLLIIFQNRKS